MGLVGVLRGLGAWDSVWVLCSSVFVPGLYQGITRGFYAVLLGFWARIEGSGLSRVLQVLYRKALSS